MVSLGLGPRALVLWTLIIGLLSSNKMYLHANKAFRAKFSAPVVAEKYLVFGV